MLPTFQRTIVRPGKCPFPKTEIILDGAIETALVYGLILVCTVYHAISCNVSCFYSIILFRKVEHVMSVQSQTCQCSHIHVSAVTFKYNSNYIESIAIMYLLFISDYAIMKYQTFDRIHLEYKSSQFCT